VESENKRDEKPISQKTDRSLSPETRDLLDKVKIILKEARMKSQSRE